MGKLTTEMALKECGKLFSPEKIAVLQIHIAVEAGNWDMAERVLREYASLRTNTPEGGDGG